MNDTDADKTSADQPAASARGKKSTKEPRAGRVRGGLALIFVAAAAFLLRRPTGAAGVVVAQGSGGAVAPTPYVPVAPSSPAAKNGALLSVLKEELFALESDKLTGAVSPAEYAETKAALETVLKRALKKNS